MNEENIQHISRSTHAISNWSMQLLQQIGISDPWVKYVNLLFLLIVLILLVLLVQYVTRSLLQWILKRIGKISQLPFFQHLLSRRFPTYLAMVVPYALVKGSIPILFASFPQAMNIVDKLVDIFLIFYVIWLIVSLVNAFADSLRLKSGMKDKPLDSYVQVVRIFLYFIGVIVIFSILTGQNMTAVITGMGAVSAILMLIFKDTILGFVASIQVSANDMVRIGDWITMPKYGADGDVIQITLTTVKVRNFDRTIVTIPPYSLVSDSFQNWRNMQESGGRRLKRCLYIKQSSVRFIRDEELKKWEKIQYLSDYINERSQEIAAFNEASGADKSLLLNGRNLTNLGLFRIYILNYLRNHPMVLKDVTLMVRQLEPSSKGLPLQLYFFTVTTNWVAYEGIVSDVFDHTVAVASYFDLELFEDISNPVFTSADTKNPFSSKESEKMP